LCDVARSDAANARILIDSFRCGGVPGSGRH
jgi:hypothetical protein